MLKIKFGLLHGVAHSVPLVDCGIAYHLSVAFQQTKALSKALAQLHSTMQLRQLGSMH